MTDRVWVGTRKGLFELGRDQAGHWAIAGHWFPGDPISMLLPEPGGRRLHAALDLGHFGVKMQRSEDGARTWSEAPVPAFPPKPDGLEDKDPMRGVDLPWSTQMIWALESGGPGELWCGVVPGGLFGSWCAPCGMTPGAGNGWAAAMISRAFTPSWWILGRWRM